MTLPSIAYVDEQPDERDNFFADAYDSELFDEIHLVHPKADISETVSELLELGIEALITDFNLADAAPINYSGEDLVAQYLKIRAGFPCFIRTSYEEEALNTSADVNRIYSKDVRQMEHAGRPLFHRISLQIEHRRKELDTWQDELQTLLAVPDPNRTAADVERILDLDTLLEASISNVQRLPKEVKAGLFAKRDHLAAETQRLIRDIKKALGDDV
jgi:hypothetical protein